MGRVFTGDRCLQKMHKDTNETSYINLLHNKNLANIVTCLPEPTSIAHSVLACKLWCHVIIMHGILCKYQPLIICGFLWPFFASLLFSPINQMALLDLIEMTKNLLNDLAESITGGPWDIADSHEGLFLLVCCQRCHTGRCSSWPVLAIFNPLTCNLWKHPPTANRCHCVGAAILHVALDMEDFCFLEVPLWCYHSGCWLSRLVCVIAFSVPGVGNDECVIHTLVHSTGTGHN
jgi:hypothetical protein